MQLSKIYNYEGLVFSLHMPFVWVTGLEVEFRASYMPGQASLGD